MAAEGGPAPVRREDYKIFDWQVNHTDLLVQIYDDYARVCVTLDVSPHPQAAQSDWIALYGEHQELCGIEIDGQAATADRIDRENGRIVLSGLSARHKISVTSKIDPYANTALEGLYASGGMLCTQCEPEGFRRLCFYPDRPDVMSVFQVRIEADRALCCLLSNGNLLETGDLPGNRHYALWYDPHKKPSYLFALVAGDLECVADSFVTASGRHVDLHIYVEKGNGHLTAHAMESLKRSMRWDEQVYGLEYDLDLFQIVAVSHFNMGAMENKGLNIFNSKFVLADSHTATDEDLNRVEAIIAHEYFHNWTGNRVTCRDWFQLTLKEGLTVFRDQCFSADMHDAAVKRADDVATLRAIQFAEDASPTAHPIRPDSYTQINNFYTPTVYEKGAEVIRMIHAQLGATGFRRGMDLYFARHDGQAVTCDDFLAAMADANDADLTGFALWYSQAGTPQLDVTHSICDSGDTLQLRFTQTLAPTPAGTTTQPMPLPVRLGLVGADGSHPEISVNGGPFAKEHVYLLDTENQSAEIRLKTAGGGRMVPSILRGFSAPVRMADDLDAEQLGILAAHDSDSFNRYEACQRLYRRLIAATLSGQPDTDSFAALQAALSRLLADCHLRDDFKALCLAVPGQSDSEQNCQPADPPRIFAARQDVQAGLAAALMPQIDEVISASAHLQTASGRALQNRLLYMAVAAGNDGAVQIAARQAEHGNMSLSMGALTALNHRADVWREQAMASFYKRWQTNALVMEKWLMLSATSATQGTTQRLASLMADPVYDAGNPNKIRAVLGAFAAANPAQFHKADGSGYSFIAEQLLVIDGRNPQIAARMGLSLTRFAHYDDRRRAQMHEALKFIAAHKLSRDLSEVISKALLTAV